MFGTSPMGGGIQVPEGWGDLNSRYRPGRVSPLADLRDYLGGRSPTEEELEEYLRMVKMLQAQMQERSYRQQLMKMGGIGPENPGPGRFSM